VPLDARPPGSMTSRLTTDFEVAPAPGRDVLLESGAAIEAETDLGRLLLQKDAVLFTPTVLAEGIWEPSMNRLMRRYLRPGMTVLDVGANIGYMSVLASQLVGEAGQVYAVEADPDNVPILQENLAHLGNGNASILPIAAWNERTTLNLFSSEGGRAGSFVSAGDVGEGRVPAGPLGDLVEGRVDFMKVDCELTDHLVVQGAERLIEANPELLITVEFNPNFTGHTGFTPARILDLYRDLRLSPYLIAETGGLIPTAFERIAAQGEGGDETTLFDFALCRGEPLRLKRERLSWRAERAFESMLKFGGDMLEYVPERIRPKIRRRDRLGRD
jgi:FkbM family methyltransferase